MQNEEYDGREDRQALAVLAGFTEHVVKGLAVTVRSAGPNMSVDVAPGMAFVQGDDSPDQGYYLVVSTAVENVPVAAPPGSGARTDLIVFRVNDTQAGGGAGAPAAIEAVAGTAGGGVPSPPPTAIVLAQVTVTAGQSAVNPTDLTDVRPSPAGRIWIENRAPTAADGNVGDAWLQTA
jgi:hypothetical protein